MSKDGALDYFFPYFSYGIDGDGFFEPDFYEEGENEYVE